MYLRKWFKTQLIDRGVQAKFADFFMGHCLDTYTQVHGLGVERLRQIYDNSNLSLKPRAEASHTDVTKVLRAVEEALRRE